MDTQSNGTPEPGDNEPSIDEINFSILPNALPSQDNEQTTVVDVGLVNDADARVSHTLYLLKTGVNNTNNDNSQPVAAGFYLDNTPSGKADYPTPLVSKDPQQSPGSSSNTASSAQTSPAQKPPAQGNSLQKQRQKSSRWPVRQPIRQLIKRPAERLAQQPWQPLSAKQLSHIALIGLVVGAAGVIGLISKTVLFPTMADPQSELYASSMGYPAQQRRLGEPIEVPATTVTKSQLSDPISAQGESVALQEVGIRPLVSGTVREVYVTEGQSVRQGAPLFQIDPEPFQRQVDLAQLNLQAAEEQLQRLPVSQREQIVALDNAVATAGRQLTVAQRQLDMQSQLRNRGAVSAVDTLEAEETYLNRQQDLIAAEQLRSQTTSNANEAIEAARVSVESSQIELSKAIRELELTRISASTNGLVSEVNLDPGEVVSQGQTGIMTLNQDMVFKAFIDQGQLDAIAVGDPATVRLVAYPGRSFDASVIRLNPTVETSPRRSGNPGENRQYTYSVWLKVEDLEMPSGLQGYAQFGTQKTSLVIPESSFVHLSNGEGMVIVAENGKAVARQVRVGRSYRSKREILEGLSPGEEIVLYPQALRPGDQLKVSAQDV
ncbi:MAG: HlyD family efflux transporter periplasmic adaptor subunit [Cyanobacteria bacterium P01_D01_bin.36]|mgnify:CR=1 FL=1